MPIFKNRSGFGVARRVRDLLSREARLIRNQSPKPGPRLEEPVDTQGQELEQMRRKLESSEREIVELRAKLVAGKDKGIDRIRPENLVWIFGTGRTGSSWLSMMMGDIDEYTYWNEPLVGRLFGNLYRQGTRNRASDRHFILGGNHSERQDTIRRFVLDEATLRFPQVGKDGYLVIKEPTGAIGALPLMEALPESRMILLIRDLRDVVASFVDANREGAWQYERKDETAKARLVARPENFLKQRAKNCVRDIEHAKEAYDAHEGRKVLVKYEDLRADTLGTMKQIYSTLELPIDDEALAQVVEKHSWENVPQEQKGQGKFHRKAMPGAWREDFTPEQAKIVEEITAPLLKEFYSVQGNSM